MHLACFAYIISSVILQIASKRKVRGGFIGYIDNGRGNGAKMVRDRGRFGRHQHASNARSFSPCVVATNAY